MVTKQDLTKANYDVDFDEEGDPIFIKEISVITDDGETYTGSLMITPSDYDYDDDEEEVQAAVGFEGDSGFPYTITFGDFENIEDAEDRAAIIIDKWFTSGMCEKL